jgi:hypothetical protein
MPVTRSAGGYDLCSPFQMQGPETCSRPCIRQEDTYTASCCRGLSWGRPAYLLAEPLSMFFETTAKMSKVKAASRRRYAKLCSSRGKASRPSRT